MPSSPSLPIAAARRILIGALLVASISALSAGNAGPWPFAIFVLSIGSPARLKEMLRLRTALDWPLLIFLGAALIGVWAAYDRSLALQKLWLLLGACLLYYAIVAQPPQNLWTAVSIFGGLGSAIAIIFLLTADWGAYPPSFAFTRPLVYSWAAIRPALGLNGLHPNVAGSLIGFLLPFQLAWLRRSHRQPMPAQRLIMTAALAISLLAIIISSSRGAILSLFVALVLSAFLPQLARLSPALYRKSRLFVLLLAGALVIISLAAITWHFQLQQALARLPLGASFVERAELAIQTIYLITDFPLIGGGLAAFPGLYSRYILGIPYFYLPNGHNIFLDLFLEQGFLGIVSFSLIVITTFWSLFHLASSRNSAISGETKLLTGATLSSLVVFLLHGMVEDTVYGSLGLPLLLLPSALAIALSQSTSEPGRAAQRQWSKANGFVLIACGALLIAALLFPRGRALWLTNLASINMAQLELARFPSAQWDHSSDVARLAPAQRMFEQAVALNEHRSTAYYRLGLIAMLRHNYEEAVDQLLHAHQINSDHIGIRKALGYSYAWSGNVEQGFLLLSQAPFVNQELLAYEHWWRSMGQNNLALITVQLQERIRAAANP